MNRKPVNKHEACKQSHSVTVADSDVGCRGCQPIVSLIFRNSAIHLSA